MADNKTADIKMSTASKTRKSLSKLQKMKDEGEKMAGGSENERRRREDGRR